MSHATSIMYTEHYMSKSVSDAVTTRDSYITPRATGPRFDIGRGFTQRVIQILTCHVHYIIYFNQTSSIVCEGVQYKVGDIGLEV